MFDILQVLHLLLSLEHIGVLLMQQVQLLPQMSVVLFTDHCGWARVMRTSVTLSQLSTRFNFDFQSIQLDSQVTNGVDVCSMRLPQTFILSSVHNVHDFLIFLVDVDWVLNFHDLFNDFFSLSFNDNFLILGELHFDDLLDNFGDFSSDYLVHIDGGVDHFDDIHELFDFSVDKDFDDDFLFHNFWDLLVDDYCSHDFLFNINGDWSFHMNIHIFLNWFFDILGDSSVNGLLNKDLFFNDDFSFGWDSNFFNDIDGLLHLNEPFLGDRFVDDSFILLVHVNLLLSVLFSFMEHFDGDLLDDGPSDRFPHYFVKDFIDKDFSDNLFVNDLPDNILFLGFDDLDFLNFPVHESFGLINFLDFCDVLLVYILQVFDILVDCVRPFNSSFNDFFYDDRLFLDDFLVLNFLPPGPGHSSFDKSLDLLK